MCAEKTRFPKYCSVVFNTSIKKCETSIKSNGFSFFALKLGCCFAFSSCVQINYKAVIQGRPYKLNSHR